MELGTKFTDGGLISYHAFMYDNFFIIKFSKFSSLTNANNTLLAQPKKANHNNSKYYMDQYFSISLFNVNILYLYMALLCPTPL